MSVPRRELLKFAGGAAAGVALTPMPWKLISGVAIRSENWPGVPLPLRGEIRTKPTACTLCRNGCAVKARCVGDQPVSLSGKLCATGVLAHHLPYHPRRLKTTLKRDGGGWHASSVDAAVNAVEAAIKDGGRVAVLDFQPGSTASLLYRRFLAAHDGLYIPAPAAERSALRLLERSAGPLGIDFENAKTVLSFGAPLLDGWGTPGRIGNARSGFRLIQAETLQSRTALMADEWLPIRPGTETALALGIANVLGASNDFPPARAASLTGIPAGTIVRIAREFGANRPSIAIGGGEPGSGPLGDAEETAIAALNVMVGSVGAKGGFIARRMAPMPNGFESLAAETPLNLVPDGAIGLLITAGASNGNALPWGLLERKLASRRLMVSVTALHEGCSRHADFVVPAPASVEAMRDTGGAADALAASFRISTPLLPAPAGAIEPADFINRVAGDSKTYADYLKERTAAIYAARRGEMLAAGTRSPLPASLEEFSKMLAEGAQWIDAPATAAAVRVALPDPPANADGRLGPAQPNYPLALAPFGWRGAAGNAALSPMMSKLYQESELRARAGCALVNPQTAQQSGLADGDNAVIETACGSCQRTVRIDEAVMPGVIQVAVGPPLDDASILSVCGIGADCTWRLARAAMRRA